MVNPLPSWTEHKLELIKKRLSKTSSTLVQAKLAKTIYESSSDFYPQPKRLMATITYVMTRSGLRKTILKTKRLQSV